MLAAIQITTATVQAIECDRCLGRGCRQCADGVESWDLFVDGILVGSLDHPDYDNGDAAELAARIEGLPVDLAEDVVAEYMEEQ
ncbi:MAG: hypothetical protein AAF604_04720 [Acidobacteriota bacterium]